MPKVELVSITPNYLDVIKSACSMPYGKMIGNKTLEMIIQSGHLSVLEHASVTFHIHCSVRVLGQLTRHRHLSFTCKSARGSKFDRFVNPLTGEAMEYPEMFEEYNKRRETDGLSFEDAAYFLPQGAETEIYVTGNFRSWYEYLPKRMCSRAMPEHRKLADMIQLELAKAAPEIFNRSFLNCKNCTEKSCSFK